MQPIWRPNSVERYLEPTLAFAAIRGLIAYDCFNELRVESMAVTLPANNSLEQCRRGRAAAFDAIVADMKKRILAEAEALIGAYSAIGLRG